MKPRYRRRIFWGLIIVVALSAMAVVFLPPLISLNYLKPKIENAILSQTGVQAQINGDVHFSLLGRVTIVADDIILQSGEIESIMISVKLSDIFNLDDAQFSGALFIDGARLDIEKLSPPKFDREIEITDSFVIFKGKAYEIISGKLFRGILIGTVRTDQHKYEFDSNGDEFHIKNKSENLYISGRLYSDGSARGTLAIETGDINRWFDFAEPIISKRIKLKMNFDWDGDYGFKFTDITSDNFSGDIELKPDGGRVISMRGENIDFDMSFLLSTASVFYNTSFDLNFTGKLKLGGRVFNHIKIKADGTNTEIKINNITADDITISGGIITKDGAKNLSINWPIDGNETYCLFSGTPENFRCTEFKYADFYGSLNVSKNVFEIFVQSKNKMPDDFSGFDKFKKLWDKGKINFQFSDASGTVFIDNKKTDIKYDFARDKSLNWAMGMLYIMPKEMSEARGDFTWNDGKLDFVPYFGRFDVSIKDNSFIITGTNAKDWAGDINLDFLDDNSYVISGNYSGKNISNLKIEIAGHTFTGGAVDNNITLKTDILNLDTFVSQKFLDNYEENQFLQQEPLITLFGINANIALSADFLIHNGDTFANFVYSLKNGVQNFSITDNERGNLLVQISKNLHIYKMNLQLNRFIINKKLLTNSMPVNIEKATITGSADLETYGKIGYDIWKNLSGNIDISFDNGVISGFGIDGFYSNAEKITTLNAEYFLSNALGSGKTKFKKMRITGIYSGGDFETNTPFVLSMRHADASGMIKLSGGKMTLKTSITLRGTSPAPAPIIIDILPDGKRNFSLSEIMRNFDPDFLRDFVGTHNRF